jgi:methylmalonyl-CoA decarboxylase subunit alpha
MADSVVSPPHADLPGVRARIGAGGAAKYHQSAAASGKMFARERIALLVDADSFSEDGVFANALAGVARGSSPSASTADGLPADGVITGTATVDGRPR